MPKPNNTVLFEREIFASATHKCLKPVKELKFHPGRQWRFDYAWPDFKVAVEVNGFGYGHGTVKAKQGDAEKLRAATLADWSVLTFTSACLSSQEKRQRAVGEIHELLELRGNTLTMKNGKLTRVLRPNLLRRRVS